MEMSERAVGRTLVRSLLALWLLLALLAPFAVAAARHKKDGSGKQGIKSGKSAKHSPRAYAPRDPIPLLPLEQQRSARAARDVASLTPALRSLLLEGDRLLNDQRDPHGAIEAWKRAEREYKNTPDYAPPFVHVEILVRVGRTLSMLGRDCDAVELWEQAALLNFHDALTVFSQAITYSNCERHRDSVPLYEEAMAMGLPAEQQTPARYMLARSLFHIGRWPRAIQLFRRVKRDKENFTDLDLLLGAALERSGDLQGALVHFNSSLLRSVPSDSRAHQRAGSVLNRLGRSEEAKALLRVHVARTPGLGQFYGRRPLQLHEALLGHSQPFSIPPLAPDDLADEPPSLELRELYTVTPLWPLDADSVAAQSRGEYAGPTLLQIDDFASAAEAAELRELFDRLHASRAAEPLACFARTSKLDSLLQAGVLGATRSLSDGSGESHECVNATAEVLSHLSFSSSTFLFHGDNPTLDTLHRRLQRVIGLPHSHGASSQILRYQPGESYDSHTDCASDTRPNDRAITALLYLSDVPSGGATHFPRLNVSISPRLGRLALFTSLDQEGFCDARSEHASVTVDEGHKYVLQKWYFSNVQPRGNTDDLFRYATGRQSVINCDYSNSCREYIKFTKDVDVTNSRSNRKRSGKAQPAPARASAPSASSKDEL